MGGLNLPKCQENLIKSAVLMMRETEVFQPLPGIPEQ